MNHSEQRAGNVEFGCAEMPHTDTDSKMMDKVALSLGMLPEGRCSKRVADDANILHTPPYSLTKKIKLDEHLVNNDPIQEHWKKGALSHRSKEMLADASDSGHREVTEGSKELSLHINCLDSTIRHDEVVLSKPHNSLEENLSESVGKDNGELDVEVEGNVEELKPHFNCLEQVLIENQRKAETSHALLDTTKSVTGSFLYRQPCDTAVYHENKQKFMTFKKKLVAYMKNRDEAQQLRSENLSNQWNRLCHAWKKKMETVEGHQNQQYCSSGLKASEQNCIVDALNVEAEVMKRLSLIVLPPPLLDSRVNQLGLLSENGTVEDSFRLNSTSKTLKCNSWTNHEHEMLIKKYTQNPKKLGLLASLLEDKNVTKEEKGENETFTMKPSGRKGEGISSGRIDASKMELGDDTSHLSGMENSVEPGVNRSLSLPEHSVSCLPSVSSQSSLTRTSRAPGKFGEADAFQKASDQLGNIPDHSHSMEEEGRVDEMHESDKAAANDDNESTATLSAEEADSHCPGDDNLTEKTLPFKPLLAAEKIENILRMKMQEYGPEHFRAEVNSSEAPHSQWFLPMSVISEGQPRHPPTNQDERKNYNTTSATRPSSALKKNESLQLVRSSAKDVDGRAKPMPELLSLNPPAAEGLGQVSYSPAPVNHFSGGQVTVRAPAPALFSRNTRSPSRIRDLINTVIEKNIKGNGNKTDVVASSRNDAWQIRQTGNLIYQPPSSSLLDMENAEVQDLSMRSSRCTSSSSSSKVTSTTAGKAQVQQAALYHYPKVDSSCHPHPAHAHRSDQRDPRAGSLLDLADAAEYERLRQLERERQQAVADRDGSFKQFETSAAEELFCLSLPTQAWRQREESGHTGPAAQLTPASVAHHYRIQNSQQTAGAYVEDLEIHPTTVGHSMEVQREPPSWQRPSYPHVVPQSPTELLHNDFLTAQRIRAIQGSSLHLQSYRPYQDVPPLRVSHATQYDVRTVRPPGAAQTAQRFSGSDVRSCPRQQLSSGPVQAEPTVTSSGGQKLYGGWHRVAPSFRNNSPLETSRERLPSTAVQADKNPRPNATSAPFRLYKPDPLGLHRISAAQLIEEIINTQINRPEGGNKVQSSSILSQIDYEISPASYDDSVFAHVPTALKSNRNGSERVIPEIGSKSAVPEKAIELNGNRAERSSIPSTESRGHLFNSDINIHRRDMELPVPKRSCISYTMASNKLLTLSSGTMQDTGTFPFIVTNMNSEDTSLHSGQVKKPTVVEGIGAVVEDDMQHGSCQNPADDTCYTTRNYVAGSDLTQRVNPQKREDLGKESGADCSSSQLARLDKANSFSSDELKSKENQEGVSKDGRSSSRQFNWKMRLLKEHQKQLVEHEDQGQTIQNSSGIGRKLSDSQTCQTPSSEILLPLNNQEGSSLVLSDTASYPTSRVSLPNDIIHCSLGSSAACVVGEDHHSAIAATHQMMSTLLSTRSGCQLGPPPPSSTTPVLPVQPDPPPLKPTTAGDSALKKAVTSEQGETRTNSPMAAAELESPGSDSQGSDHSGRLVIRMDSAEDWKSS